jgi:hypothetical protein
MLVGGEWCKESRRASDFARLIDLTSPEAEVELKVVQPRDARVDLFGL